MYNGGIQCAKSVLDSIHCYFCFMFYCINFVIHVQASVEGSRLWWLQYHCTHSGGRLTENIIYDTIESLVAKSNHGVAIVLPGYDTPCRNGRKIIVLHYHSFIPQIRFPQSNHTHWINAAISHGFDSTENRIIIWHKQIFCCIYKMVSIIWVTRDSRKSA